MRFARVHKVAVYLLAGLGLVTLWSGGELGGAPSILLALGFCASWFAEGDLLQSRRYVRAWTIALVVALIVEVARWLLFGLAPLTAAVEFASLLQLSRLANRRTARDYQQVTVLALLHLIAATVLGGGLSYAACFMGFVIVTPWAMTLGHLRREIEGNYLADARAGRQGVPIDVARILRSRRVVGPGLLVGSSLLALPIFAMTAVIFVAFPRIGLGLLTVRSTRGGQVAGLGDQVDLSGHGTIRDDPTIVLRIEPPDLGNDPPVYQTFRLRGAAFDTYDGHVWTRHPATRVPVQREGAFYSLQRGRWAVAGLHRPYRVVLDALEPPVVLLPAGAVSLRIEPRIEAGVPRYPELTIDPAGEVRYTATDDLGLVYTAFVEPEDVEGKSERIPPSALARYLTLPPVSPRLIALAHELTDREPTVTAKARAVESYLSRFRYTLTLESGSAERPIEDFLFRTRAGHCEYFSTAMAVLLRAVGVPTRNVTGFLGGTYNRYGRFYAIRQGDAHSWVEVYDPYRGWMTFDPTPASRESSAGRAGLLVELDAFVEAMRVRWRRYIVGFDLGTQARIAARVMRAFDSGQRRSEGDARNRSGRSGSIGDVLRRAVRSRAVWALVGFAALATMGVYALRRGRARASTRGRSGPMRAQVRKAVALARALDAALAARGHPRPRQRSPVGFAQELERAGAPIGPLARQVAERYAAARFGNEPLREDELDALRRALRNAPNPLA